MGIRVGAAVLILAVAVGCGEATAPVLLLDARVRVLHAAPETPRMEVVLENESRTLLEYAEVSDFITIGSGDRRLQLIVAGETEALIDLETTLDPDAQYTVLAAGVGGEIEPIVLLDDPAPADTGETRIRLVHAAPTAGDVDIYVTEPGADLSGAVPIVASVAFGESSDYMVFDARTYQVRVAVSGSDVLLVDLPLLVLSSMRVMTLVIMDTMGSGPPHGLIALSDRRP